MTNMTPELSGIPKRIDTKEYIVRVFQELLKRESFDSLSVRSIAEACGISRTTFYRLFQDKYDLLIWDYNQRINEICADVSSERERLSLILELMHRNKQCFQKVLKSDKGQVLEDCLFQRSFDSIRARLLQESRLQSLPDALLTKIEFCCVGTRHIVKKWLFGDLGEAPGVIAERIMDCFPEPIRSHCLTETAGSEPHVDEDE